MVNLQVECIKNLIFKGKFVGLNVMFLVVMNNYCVYGGKFVGMGDSYIVFVFLDENCVVLVVWIGVELKCVGEIYLVVDNNWCLVLIYSDMVLDICFEILSGDKVVVFIKVKGQYLMKKVVVDDIGFVIYQVDLSK